GEEDAPGAGAQGAGETGGPGGRKVAAPGDRPAAGAARRPAPRTGPGRQPRHRRSPQAQGRANGTDQGDDRGPAERVADHCAGGVTSGRLRFSKICEAASGRSGNPMSILIPEKELPVELSNEQAVEAADSAELAE